MSLPAQNLHEFVLNLLNDEAARSAFAADPTSALAAAGLSDVTPQDIQEVAPLVADYAPAPLADALSALPLDAGTAGLQGAIAQLQAVAQVADALPVGAPELPLDLPARADLPTDALPTGALPIEAPELGDLPALSEVGHLPVHAPSLPADALPGTLPGLDELPVEVPGLPVELPARNDLPVDALPVNALPVNALPIDALPTDGLPVELPELGDLPLDAPALPGELPVNALPVNELPIEALPTNGLPVELPELDGLPALPADLPARNDLPVNALPIDQLPIDQLPIDQLPLGALPLDAAELPVSLPEVEGLTGALPQLPVELPNLGEVPSLPGLGAERADVPNAVTGLPVDTADLPVGTEDLTGLAGTAGLADLPLDTDALGALPVDAPSLGDSPFTAPDLDIPVVGRIDTDSATSADGYATTVSYAGHVAEGAAAAAVDAKNGAVVGGTAGTPAGSFLGSAAGSTGGFTGGFGIQNNEGAVQAGLTADDDAVLGGAHAESALGRYGVGIDSAPADLPNFDQAGDLAGSLDSDVLSRSEPAAGPIADYVSIGGDLLGGKIAQSSATLGEYLTAGGAQFGASVANAGAQAGTAVSDGGHQAADLASDLPAAPGVPSALPAEVPTTIPAGDLPVHPSAELPQGLPHLPVANPLPEVTHHVEHVLSTDPGKEVLSVTDSPLTDTIGPLNHAPLPEAADLGGLHGDLPLGH
ncbi:IniB N-terminal domain-containing protein [Amycolatopsis viridis]|uniref:Uncharacterized protein n=1 Tax=Amycolatopsis viridis TaxID=185678 RepID=A0ABX0T647_9PSEU|nr:IniB N-terminal domain-containing protein [Amycolatopsis viridis]NIH83046.1 hypothetical protein [Amycolatopsis viridis]